MFRILLVLLLLYLMDVQTQPSKRLQLHQQENSSVQKVVSSQGAQHALPLLQYQLPPFFEPIARAGELICNITSQGSQDTIDFTINITLWYYGILQPWRAVGRLAKYCYEAKLCSRRNPDGMLSDKTISEVFARKFRTASFTAFLDSNCVTRKKFYELERN